MPKLIVPGGRNGAGVTSVRTEPNAFVRGAGERVFETDQEGKVIRDIDKNRIKLREIHRNEAGQTFEKMEKAGPPTSEDLEILRRMGL